MSLIKQLAIGVLYGLALGGAIWLIINQPWIGFGFAIGLFLSQLK
jgi:hypothetical protein